MSHLANSTDAHVQGVGTATSPVQNLGGELHGETPPLGLAVKGAGRGGVVGHGDPLIGHALVFDVIVVGALLGAKVSGVRRTVLREERKKG